MDVAQHKAEPGQAALIVLWSLLPGPAIWFGLHHFKSAVWCYILYHSIAAIAIVYGYRYWRPTLIRPTARQLFVVLIASLLFSGIAILLYDNFGQYAFSASKAVDALKQQGWCDQLFWPISLYVIIVNPIMEEFLWRGVVLNALESTTGRNHFAMIWSSVMYGAIHYPIVSLVVGPTISLVCVTLLSLHGAVLGVIYKRTKSIVLTSLLHGLLNDVAAVAIMVRLFANAAKP